VGDVAAVDNVVHVFSTKNLVKLFEYLLVFVMILQIFNVRVRNVSNSIHVIP